MIFFETLRDLVRLLDTRGRLIALVLVGMLALSGALEIAGLFFLFGYLASLGGATGSISSGFVNGIYEAAAGGLEGAPFALAAGAVLVAVFLAKNTLWLLSTFALLRFSMKRYEYVSGAIFDGYQEMPLELMRARGTNEPEQVISSVLTVFQIGFTPLLQAAADIAVILAMLVALTIVVDFNLVIGSGVVLGTTALVFLSLTRRLSHSLGQRLTDARLNLSIVVGEALRGLLDVRLAGRQDVMQRRFGEVAGEFALADRRIGALELIPRALNELVLATGIVMAAAWFATGEGGLAGALPTLAVLGFAGLRITAATARLTQLLQLIRQAKPPRDRMMAAIERAAPQILSDKKHDQTERETYRAEDLPLPDGASPTLSNEISVKDVTFTYPGAQEAALKSISVPVQAGEFVALCGPSGGGKSTLSLVMMGLLKPQSGVVECDGWDIHRHISAWHRQIGHVGQTPFIIPRTLRENVALGLPPHEIDDDAVWKALEQAALGDFFRESEKGLDTVLGEQGALLSGGQRQRVAIARALYHDPAVLVFDEATAALDTATEREISRAISELTGEKTIIAIAHRLTTIENADTIHLVERGEITASGTYEELCKNPVFGALAGKELTP